MGLLGARPGRRCFSTLGRLLCLLGGSRSHPGSSSSLGVQGGEGCSTC
jgi:hypothetical protein